MSHSGFWGRSCTAFWNTQHHDASHIQPVVLTVQVRREHEEWKTTRSENALMQDVLVRLIPEAITAVLNAKRHMERAMRSVPAPMRSASKGSRQLERASRAEATIPLRSSAIKKSPYWMTGARAISTRHRSNNAATRTRIVAKRNRQ